MARCEVCGAPLPARLPAPWFDLETHAITADGDERRLGARPWQLLETLWRHRGQVVGLDRLMDAVYGGDPDPPFDPVIRVMLSRVGRALRGTPYTIENIYGHGWRLAGPGIAAADSAATGALEELA